MNMHDAFQSAKSIQILVNIFSILFYSHILKCFHSTFSVIEGENGEPHIDIRLGHAVRAIEIDDITEQAVITTSSGDTFFADSVIVTVPLGVLKQGNITFSPPLPQNKINSIKSLGNN